LELTAVHSTRTGNQTYQAALDILHAAMPVHDDAGHSPRLAANRGGRVARGRR
jgi:hypothetical protein